MRGTEVRLATVLLILTAALLLPLLVTGCSKEEAPSSPGYYTGPMKKRGAPPNAGEPAGKAAPAAGTTQ